MNGTGEADPLEIVRSEVRLPHLEPFSDLLTHILNYTTYDGDLRWCEVTDARKGTLGSLSLASALAVSLSSVKIHTTHSNISLSTLGLWRTESMYLSICQSVIYFSLYAAPRGVIF